MAAKKILFVGEAATLAHIARPLVLATALDRDRFDVSFACDPRYKWVMGKLNARFFSLRSVGSDHFLAALRRGSPLYDQDLLTRYVQDDLELLKECAPDVVVGDFRLSLSVSARLARVPYVAISNCYWSPYWQPRRYPVPSLPLTAYLPMPIANALFQFGRPFAFALHCRPLNQVRRRYGLSSLGSDLRRIYTDADYVVYADVPELFRDARLPAEHRFIGAVLWSPPVDVPPWWHSLPADRRVVYVTMGSSGQASLLSAILQSLGRLDVTVIAATAGNPLPESIPSNAHVAAYLPGLQASRRASLVVCNGGAPTCHQALAAGVPVVGVPSNLDQFLNMGTLTESRVGLVERADRLKPASLRCCVEAILADGSYTGAAERIEKAIAENDAPTNFARFLEEVAAS